MTAIVGSSGSGKTTLLKMLLKFYEPTHGDIRVGNVKISSLDSKVWREKCGVVLQTAIFFLNNSQNIALSDEVINYSKLHYACKTANILEFIESLPLGYQTKIGMQGSGLSQGQKQRILIARAVYKDPQYIFFDEATNSLDANNEKIIVNELQNFFKGGQLY
jgi:ATP-binding cassette subfamily B protein